ncbi:scarecrow-like protein 6 [Tanacetum coccineum]
MPQIESMVMGKLQCPEQMPHWKTLFTAGGYSPVVLSNYSEGQADCVVKRTQVRGFHVEKSTCHLCFAGRTYVIPHEV